MTKFFKLLYVKVFLIAMVVLTVGLFLTVDNLPVSALVYRNVVSTLLTLLTLYLIKYHPNFVNWLTVIVGLLSSVFYFWLVNVVDNQV